MGDNAIILCGAQVRWCVAVAGWAVATAAAAAAAAVAFSLRSLDPDYHRVQTCSLFSFSFDPFTARLSSKRTQKFNREKLSIFHFHPDEHSSISR